MIQAALSPHPATAAGCVQSLDVRVERAAPSTVSLQYRVRADIEQLLIPPPASTPQRRDGLWRHTCFELFATRPNASDYMEFNLSPAGDWAAYRFDDYRQGMSPMETIQAPRVIQARTASQLDVSVWINMPLTVASRLSLGICAVIEDRAGALSYWALTHPQAQPDFHHRGGFVLDLP